MMSDGFLSQNEIEALLQGEPVVSTDDSEILSEVEQDALGEIGNISMGSAATTLSVLLGNKVSITTPRVSTTTLRELQSKYPVPYLVIEVAYTHGVLGSNILAMREQDALIIADLMMGNDGTNPPAELNDLYMSAVGEAMNQMMGSVATSMSTIFKKKVDISPPIVSLIDFSRDQALTGAIQLDESISKVAFRMEVGELIDSEIMQIMPIGISKDMVKNLVTATQIPEPRQPIPELSPVRQSQTAYAEQPVGMPVKKAASGAIVQPVQFSPLSSGALAAAGSNINLIMDVPMQITVELGRTKKLIREVLDLTPGSVVELDKLAGEPVDVLANGKLIAKGEVVVIDENFGVRITDIVSPLERATTLQ